MNHVKKPMHEDPEKALDYCIYEYLVKKKCFSAAEAFLMEKKIDKETASNTNDDSEPSILDFWEPFHVMYAGYKKVGYERPELAAFFQAEEQSNITFEKIREAIKNKSKNETTDEAVRKLRYGSPNKKPFSENGSKRKSTTPLSQSEPTKNNSASTPIMSSILSASNNEKSEGTTTLSSQNIMTISLPPQTLPITSWDNLQADSKDLTTTGLGIDQAMSNPEMLINQSIQMGDMGGQMQGNLMVQNVANLNAQQQYVASQHALHRHQLKRQGTNPNIIPPLVAAIPPQMRPNMGVMINNNNINLPLQRDVFTQHHKQVQFLKIQQFRARQQLFVQPQGFGHGLMQNVGGSNPLLQQQFNQMQMLNQFPQQNQMDMMQSSFPIPHHDVFASIPDIPIDFNTQLNPNNLSISSSENQTTMSNFSNGLQNDPLLTNSIISQEHNGILQKEMNSKPDNLGSSDSYQGPTINGMKCDPVRTDLEEIEDFERYINSAPFIPNFNGGNINGNNINGNSHLNGNGQMGGKNGSEGPRNV